MPLQLGRCAFTAACSFPGPRFRIQGTNREVCRVHARVFQLAFASPAPADQSPQLRAPAAPGRAIFSVLNLQSTGKGPKES